MTYVPDYMPGASPAALIAETKSLHEEASERGKELLNASVIMKTALPISRDKTRRMRPSTKPIPKDILKKYFKHAADGRSLLRPRYLHISNKSISVAPKALHPQTISVLSESGGPYINNSFSIPWTQDILQPCEYFPTGYKRGYTVETDDQWHMSHLFFRTTPTAGLYLVNASIRTFAVRQLIFSMQIHATQSMGARNVKWTGLYGGYRNELCEDPKTLDLLIIGNVHEGLDPVKFGKLRDILHQYRDIPIILVMDGLDPLEFALDKLRAVPRMVLNIAAPRLDRIEKYIRVV